MYLLLNDKEIAHFLLSLIDYKKVLSSLEISWKHSTEYTMNCDSKMFTDEKSIPKFKDKVKKAVVNDLKEYFNTAKEILITRKQIDFNLIHENIEYVINRIGKEKILDLYLKSNKNNFVKSTGKSLTNTPILIRRNDFDDYKKDCLIRNTVGNENLLLAKLDNHYPFWFIDSGYTNFLETKKTYHRIVRNHLHFGKLFEAPVDRLGVFKKFPLQWRSSGEKILIVEPGPFAASVFHIDLRKWRYDVEKELRNYTDKPLIFRKKVDKKIRNNLYEEFCNEDYYSVVSLNSNASTEAIWAGIPTITLGTHITNPVSRSKLSDINKPFKPNLASWLCMLSYSQFTYNELIDGTAIKIVKQYYE